MKTIDRWTSTATRKAWPVWRRRASAAGLIAGACLVLAACGGGGGGGDTGSGAVAQLGLVKLTVKDGFGAPVVGATVLGPRETSLTDAQGVALVSVSSPDGTAAVILSSASFSDKSVVVSSSSGTVNEVVIALERKTSPAGGSLASRGSVLPLIDSSGGQLTFEIELVVVGADAKPVENLSAANFMLRACTPLPGNGRVNCVRSASADLAYAPMTTPPAAVQHIAGLPARNFAAGLLLDQSGSIRQSDPTGARLFSTKAFLSGLGPNDQALLATFAGGIGALIPTVPLTVYAPFRTQAAASAYFPTLDSLTALLGGNTPLYESLDTLRRHVLSDPALPAGQPKALIVFTDGDDTSCGNPDACRAKRAQSIREAKLDQVRIFTIGLSSGVDVAALAELAHQTGGAFLYADTAEQLLPLYGSVGKLLSLSLPSYRLRWTVQADASGRFSAGTTLLGRVQVTVDGSTFDVPFVVGIP